MALLLVPCASGAQVGRRVTVIGPGNVTCGSRTLEARQRPQGSPRSLQQDGWILGYLTARSAVVSGDLIGPYDADGLIAAVDLHCAANPLDTLYSASAAVFAQMVARANR